LALEQKLARLLELTFSEPWRAMVKRSASKRPTRPPKAAKIRNDTASHPFAEEVLPVLSLLDEAHDLPDSCREMLVAMAPHALQTAREDRHEYQNEMLRRLGLVFKEIQEKQHASLDNIKKMMQETDTGTASVDAALAAARAESENLRAQDAETSVALRQAQERVSGCALVLKMAQGRQEDVLADSNGLSSEKERYENLAKQAFRMMKSCPASEEEEDKRQRLCRDVLAAVAKMDDQNALLVSLPGVLRTKPSELSPFGRQCIEFCENAFRNHIDSIGEKMQERGREVTTHAQTVSNAETALRTAKEQQEATQAKFSKIHEALEEATNRELQAQKAVEEEGRPNPDQLRKKLKEQERHVASIQILVSRFEELVERSRGPPAELAQAVAQ